MAEKLAWREEPLDLDNPDDVHWLYSWAQQAEEERLRANELLKLLSQALNLNDTSYPVSFREIPPAMQEDFFSWAEEYQQQDWRQNAETGWRSYQLQYLRFLIDKYFDEVSE
jgi:hypothetical protein